MYYITYTFVSCGACCEQRLYSYGNGIIPVCVCLILQVTFNWCAHVCVSCTFYVLTGSSLSFYLSLPSLSSFLSFSLFPHSFTFPRNTSLSTHSNRTMIVSFILLFGSCITAYSIIFIYRRCLALWNGVVATAKNKLDMKIVFFACQSHKKPLIVLILFGWRFFSIDRFSIHRFPCVYICWLEYYPSIRFVY